MDNDYLIKKPPLQALFLFALPMIIGNLFQQTYTMVDSAIVGRYVSEQALAAVGASYALTNIFICVAIGGGIGASVIVSRYFGAKEYGRMKTAVFTALLSFLGISLVLGIAGLILGKQIMIWLNTRQTVWIWRQSICGSISWGCRFCLCIMYFLLCLMHWENPGSLCIF